MTPESGDRYASNQIVTGIDRMGDLRLLLTTCGTSQIADELAAALVERRLAACVNVLPEIRSTYRWDGKIEQDREVLVLIKTTESQLEAIEATVKTVSGYELPELIAVEITGGAADFLAWVRDEAGGRETT
jgi:periplasmic divalent cation tolerance protein